MRFTALAVVPGLALVLFACSSEAPTGSVQGGSSPSKNESSSKAPSSTSSSSASNPDDESTSSDPTDPAPAGGTCSAKADQEACFQCCDEANPGGYDVLMQAFGDCACAADKCATACGQSFCAGQDPQPGDACDTCLTQQEQTCGALAEAACEKDANCTKALDCEEASGCYDKPE